VLSSITWLDILGCLRGVIAFAFVLLAPGYCLAWACDLLGFRRRPAHEQLPWAVALSFGVMTIASVLLGKYVSLSAVCCLALLCGAFSLALVAARILSRPATPDQSRLAPRTLRLATAVAAAFILFVIAELVDIGIGPHLYLSFTVFDHALRTAFVDSVLRTGVPPANPLFWPGHAASMRYYYFWYVLTAAAARLAAATSRQAMIASVVWAGFGLAAIVALYCRHFLAPPQKQPRRWSRLALALALLAVTGLDILPAMRKAVLHLPTDPDMDWWSATQVTSWLDSLLWVPHHIAGLVCCLLGFLLVWISQGSPASPRTASDRALCAIIAGLSFAGAFGLSSWVALAFALVMPAWIAWVLVSERASRPRIPVLLFAGLVAVVALLPYLAELRHAPSIVSSSNHQSASDPAEDPALSPPAAPAANNGLHLLRFGVRYMIDPNTMRSVPGFAALERSRPPVEHALAALILLLPGYFVELGFYGLVLVLALAVALKRLRNPASNPPRNAAPDNPAPHEPAPDEADRTALALTCASLFLATFLRSTVIANNDFGMRSVLIAQFFLLLLAVRWFEGAFGNPSPSLRRVMLSMLWIGVAGTAYQALALRLFLPAEDRLGRPAVAGLAEEAMALRLGFDQMDRRISKDAVIQFDTDQPSDYFRFAQIMQARRQIASALPDCPAAFGGDASACVPVEQDVARLFAPTPLSAADARALCRSLGVNYLVATRWDATWRYPLNWVWTLPVAFNSNDLRILDCTAPTR